MADFMPIMPMRKARSHNPLLHIWPCRCRLISVVVARTFSLGDRADDDEMQGMDGVMLVVDATVRRPLLPSRIAISSVCF